MQVLSCLSHTLRIWFVAVCLDVFRHFHRTRKVVWNVASRTDTVSILRCAIFSVKGECHLGNLPPGCLGCHL